MPCTFTDIFLREMKPLKIITNYQDVRCKYKSKFLYTNKLIQSIVLLHNLHLPNTKLHTKHAFFSVEE